MTSDYDSVLVQIDSLVSKATELREKAHPDDRFVIVGVLDCLLEGRRQLAIAKQRGWV